MLKAIYFHEGKFTAEDARAIAALVREVAVAEGRTVMARITYYTEPTCSECGAELTEANCGVSETICLDCEGWAAGLKNS